LRGTGEHGAGGDVTWCDFAAYGGGIDCLLGLWLAQRACGIPARYLDVPMTTTISSAAIVAAEPVFTLPERLALAGVLASDSGLTRDAYMLDLRQFTTWCHQHGQRLFEVRRADIECFAGDLGWRHEVLRAQYPP
jgi:hypothetical protein